MPEFLDVCRKSGIVEEPHLTKLQGPAAASPVAAAKTLVRLGVLTKFQAAQLVAGKYKGLKFDRLIILEKLGSGGMGTVFLCEHTGLRKKVAVKVLPPEQAADEGTRERFFREARAAAVLDHPNIVRVFDTNSSNGVHYMVMEYVEGQDLQSILNKYGPVPHTRACTYVAQAALGLQHAAEKGLIHRDIKPGNLLVDKDGVVKILDMGLARFTEDAEDNNLTAKYDKGAVLGTADYMAPEQIIASSSVDTRADIYSLGVTLYTLINGKPPFSGSSTQKLVGHQTQKATSLTQIRREVPKALSAVVEKMMAKLPKDRYQTAEEVVSALSPWLESETIPIDSAQTRKFPSGKVPIKVPPKKNRRAAVMAVLAFAVVGIAGGVYALVSSLNDDTSKAVASTPTGPSPQPSPAKPDPKPADSPKGTVNPAKVSPVAVVSEQSRVVYEADFTKIAKFEANLVNKKAPEIKSGALPTEWTAQVWDASSKGSIETANYLNVQALAFRTNEGKASAEIYTRADKMKFRLSPGRQYRVEVEYSSAGKFANRLDVRFRELARPGIQVSLPSTGPEWRRVTMEIGSPFDRDFGVQLYLSNSNVGEDSTLYIKSVKLVEMPPPVAGQQVYKLDLSKATPTVTRAKGGSIEGANNLPDKFRPHSSDRDTTMEAAIEAIDGVPSLTFRSTGTKASAMLFGPVFDVVENHQYRITLTYRLLGNSAGGVKINDSLIRGRSLQTVPPTGAEWNRAEIVFRPGRSIGGAMVELANGSVTDKFIIRGLEVHDLGEVPAGKTVYQSEFGRIAPVTARYRGREPEAGSPSFTALDSYAWNKDSLMEVAAADGAVTVSNVEGPQSAMLFSPHFPVRPNGEYWLTMEYRCEADIAGAIKYCGPPVRARDIAEIVGTRGEWRVLHVPFRVNDGEGKQGRIEFFPRGQGVKNGLTIRSMRISEANGSANAVVSQSYLLDLSRAHEFARRYRGREAIESQGDGQLPADWSAETASNETLGDVYIDKLGSTKAIGLRNHSGPPTTRVFSRSDLISAVAGKTYLVQVTYQTEPKGKGWLAVHLGGVEANREMLPSSDDWRTVEVRATATAKGGLTVAIGCESVGSESAIFIKSVEVKEAP